LAAGGSGTRGITLTGPGPGLTPDTPWFDGTGLSLPTWALPQPATSSTPVDAPASGEGQSPIPASQEPGAIPAGSEAPAVAPTPGRIHDEFVDRRPVPSEPVRFQEITFITMELLSGITLGEHLLKHGPLPEAEALPIIEQMAAGLGAAHAAGVIHRDLKSSNL